MATTTDNSDAVEKVFNTFELLEKILIQVLADVPHSGSYYRLRHLKHLHRLQRVNSTFREVTSRSKTIRVGTFRDQQPSIRRGEDSASDARVDQKYTSEEIELAINPFFHHPEVFLSGIRARWLDFPEGRPGTGVTFGVVAGPAVEERQMAGYTAWRRMLFANVPLRINLRLQVLHYGAGVSPERRIELGSRVTLGEVADEVMKGVRDIEEADERS